MAYKEHGNAFVTLYPVPTGWKPVIMVWDDEDEEYFPARVAYFAQANKDGAIAEARAWAASEELEFIL